ncbi:hypothetical protein L7F22_008085 [Adiantum nelumboides]|nr:hypothetical protein [Adiantum nelumboides]
MKDLQGAISRLRTSHTPNLVIVEAPDRNEGCFWEPQGTCAHVDIGRVLLSVWCKDNSGVHTQEALRCAKFKCLVGVGTRSFVLFTADATQEEDVVLGITLVDMYAKCGGFKERKDAREASFANCRLLECIDCRICPARVGPRLAGPQEALHYIQ